MSCPRAVAPILVLVLAACGGEAGDDSGSGAATGTDSANTGGSTAATTAPTTTTATTAPTTTMEGATGGDDDDCDDRPGGEWNACSKDGNTQNSLCNWVMGPGEGSITCLVPASGGYNVCGISQCADDCDCFAPPVTGTALVKCKAVFADGGKACVLYCLNGQICPDGMECVGGTCYWPN